MSRTATLGSFKPGNSGNPTGRPKNRVRLELDSAKKDPVKELLKLLPDLSPNKQADVWLELLSYLQGKPKDVELNLTTEEMIEILESRLPKAS